MTTLRVDYRRVVNQRSSVIEIATYVAESQSRVWFIFKWFSAMLLLSSTLLVACLRSFSRVVKFLPVSAI